MLDYLPEEISHSILFRLSLQCLIICTCVCKPWKSLIKNSNFIRDHLAFTNKYGRPLLLLHCATRKRCDSFSNQDIMDKEERDEFYSLHYDNHDFSQYCEVQVPNAVDNRTMPCLHVVGTCNGLVCLADDLAAEANKVIICNPLIRKSVTLPLHNSRIETYDYTRSTRFKYNVSIGFGYDAATNDYKVVRLVTLLNVVVVSDLGSHDTVAEVYSLATGSWSPLRHVDGVSEMAACTPQAFVNGILHWLAIYEAKDGNSYYFILTFDVHNESFSKMMMPEMIPSSKSAKWQVSISSDGKSIAVFYRHFSDTVVDRFLDIWKMQEYGVHDSWTIWTRLRPRGPSGSLLPKALCFRVNGQILSEIFDDHICQRFWHLYCMGHQLYSIHPAGVWRFLEHYSGFRYYTVNSYKESLVLLDMDNAESY